MTIQNQMNITPILRTSAVRSLLWSLILLFASALPAWADDEFWNGGGSFDYGSSGGYGCYGEVVSLPPFPVNGNDPATEDWTSFINRLYGSGAIGSFDDTQNISPAVEVGNYSESGASSYAASGTSFWDANKSKAVSISPSTRTGSRVLDTFLKVSTNPEISKAITNAISVTRDVAGQGPKLWEAGVAIRISSDGSRVQVVPVSGPGPNQEISVAAVTAAFNNMPTKAADDVLVFFHDHKDQGAISNADVSNASIAGILVVARDENRLEFAAPIDGTTSSNGGTQMAFAQADCSAFSIPNR